MVPVNKTSTKPTGRTANKLSPKADADGNHSTFARDNDGNIYKYEEYKKVENPAGDVFWDKVKRFDGGKMDGDTRHTS